MPEWLKSGLLWLSGVLGGGLALLVGRRIGAALSTDLIFARFEPVFWGVLLYLLGVPIAVHLIGRALDIRRSWWFALGVGFLGTIAGLALWFLSVEYL